MIYMLLRNIILLLIRCRSIDRYYAASYKYKNFLGGCDEHENRKTIKFVFLIMTFFLISLLILTSSSGISKPVFMVSHSFKMLTIHKYIYPPYLNDVRNKKYIFVYLGTSFPIRFQFLVSWMY